MPTMLEIAHIAGVSKASVSHALNNTGRLSPQLRERLIRILRENGYTPHPAYAIVSNLRKHRQKTDALVPIAIFCTPNDLPLYESHAAKLGYRIIIIDSQSAPSAREAYHLATRQGAAGMIIHEYRSFSHFSEFNWANLSVVFRGSKIINCRYHHIGPRPFDHLVYAWSKVKAKGYKRIGAILGRHFQPILDDTERMAACLVSQNGEDPHNIIPPCLEFVHTLGWYNQYKPDAIIALNDLCFHEIKLSGSKAAFYSLHVPEEPSPLNPLEGILHDVSHYAIETLRFLDYCIKHNEKGRPATPLSISLPIHWIERNHSHHHP